MISNSLPLSFLSLFSFVSFFVFLLILYFSKKTKLISLLDEDFSKPQAFHKEAIPRCGGLAFLLSFVIFLVLYHFIFEKLLLDYLIITLSLFLLGFLDDIKIRVSPNVRLLLMIFILLASINIFDINIEKTGFAFLNSWLENHIFKYVFILLCFLFVINGANLIDGFNGLLGWHVIIINLILIYLNMLNNQNDFVIILTGQTIVFFVFLLFNFPNAKMFLGDGGSYAVGSLIALNVVKTSLINPDIHPFFFCVILFYIFYEVFFSFFRKIFKKKSPLKPDEKHLHMLVFKKLNSLNLKNSNALTALLINLIYLSAILPILFGFEFGHENALFYRYWFFALLAVYTLIYAKLYKSKK
tara:strand:+ start:61 stop:1128 length:1068 start_codon:yes stop_codon:yes gene_type:complete